MEWFWYGKINIMWCARMPLTGHCWYWVVTYEPSWCFRICFGNFVVALCTFCCVFFMATLFRILKNSNCYHEEYDGINAIWQTLYGVSLSYNFEFWCNWIVWMFSDMFNQEKNDHDTLFWIVQYWWLSSHNGSISFQ